MNDVTKNVIDCAAMFVGFVAIYKLGTLRGMLYSVESLRKQGFDVTSATMNLVTDTVKIDIKPTEKK